MRDMKCLTAVMVVLTGSALGRAESGAYIERWASGTLTTGEDFESWRIHVVVPDGDDWGTSAIDGWLTGGATWYLEWPVGGPPDPVLFPTHPDSEFAYYYTSPHLYPNSEELGSVTITADGRHEPTYVHLGGWSDYTFDTNGDYVVWQGTVLDPAPDVYGRIEFDYVTRQSWAAYTFLIPEPATLGLLALGACVLRRRR